jgi:hypothetical protein
MSDAPAKLLSILNMAGVIISDDADPHYSFTVAEYRELCEAANAVLFMIPPPPGPDAVQLPEGFVEFAMRAMKEAQEQRSRGGAEYTVAYADFAGKAHWFASANVAAMTLIGESAVDELVKIAGAAIVLAVEPTPTLEGKAN